MNEADSVESIARILKIENQHLKDRIVELEKKAGRTSSGDTQRRTPDMGVMKLIEQKNTRLEEYAAELEQKHELLQEATKEMAQRNEQLSLWMSTLKLYAQIFENEAAAMIGLNQDGKIILLNKNAPSVMGQDLKEHLYEPIDSLDFSALDPNTPTLVHQVLSDRKEVSSKVEAGGRKVTTVVYPMGSESEGAGALVKITVDSGA